MTFKVQSSALMMEAVSTTKLHGVSSCQTAILLNVFYLRMPISLRLSVDFSTEIIERRMLNLFLLKI
jgi:hypothetical protein